jgi:hypothetical protein
MKYCNDYRYIEQLLSVTTYALVINSLFTGYFTATVLFTHWAHQLSQFLFTALHWTLTRLLTFVGTPSVWKFPEFSRATSVFIFSPADSLPFQTEVRPAQPTWLSWAHLPQQYIVLVPCKIQADLYLFNRILSFNDLLTVEHTSWMHMSFVILRYNVVIKI